MAEGVVGVLIGKLAAALVIEASTLAACVISKEASVLKGLFSDIRYFREELESMQAYLRWAERLRNTDEVTSVYVKKIRGIAFEVEDVIDEFTYKLQDKDGRYFTKLKKRIKHVKTWHQLARRLQEIKQSLNHASERRVRYDTRGTEDESRSSVSCSVGQASYFAKGNELVGIEENVKLLRQWLTDDPEQHSMIATVWGMGGVGKTTLVSHVYSMVKVDFDSAAWVTVSKSYQVEHLLKMIAGAFCIPVDVANMEKRSLVETISCFLQGKRYVIVLDDVWDVGMWFQIRDAFPTDGSVFGRFVITSRIFEVAHLSDRNCRIELGPLEMHHSKQLFCFEVFWRDQNKTCPHELEDLANKFVSKCGGLPLAIACIGRQLSYRNPTYADWDGVYKELELQLTNNMILDVSVILRVSLEDLPYDLKNCFLLCSIFPEDYLIKRRMIMRHWMTAGFIKEQRNKTLEEVAEGYLHELVNRSLLQVVERNTDGRVRSCRMHDIMRLLVLTKATEECFCTLYSGSLTDSVDVTRRLSVQSTNIIQWNLPRATNLRALHVFKSDINIDMLKPILASSVWLSTLDLKGTEHLKILPDEVFKLFNLRYLGLRQTAIEILPEKIGRLQNLEVLDAAGTKLLSLPRTIIKLQKLRYLYAGRSFISDAEQHYGGITAPKGIGCLTGLYALHGVMASSETLHDVASLIELRTFAVSSVRNEHRSDLCSAISKMNHLVHLLITMSNENDVLPLDALRLPQTLCKLVLEGQLEKESMPQIISSWSHLKNLTRLCLSFSKLDEGSFSCLLVLHCLCWLELVKAYDGKSLQFPSTSFPELKYLCIWGAPKLCYVEIEEGAMGKLPVLVFSNCPELKFLPHGVEYLSCLEKFILEDTSEDLIEELLQNREPHRRDEDIIRKINHIRNVTVCLKHKGIRERIR